MLYAIYECVWCFTIVFVLSSEISVFVWTSAALTLETTAVSPALGVMALEAPGGSVTEISVFVCTSGTLVVETTAVSSVCSFSELSSVSSTCANANS